MKAKTLSFLTLTLFAILVLTSFVSAEINIGTAPILSPSENSFEITITATENGTINFSADSIEDSNGKLITFTSISDDFEEDIPKTITISYDVDPEFDFEFEKEYSTTLNAVDSLDSEINDSVKLIFNENTRFYKGDNEGDLQVSDIEFEVLDGFGDDEDYWYPFDEVEITFNVENNGDWDIKDIEIQVCVWDETKERCIFDEDDMEIDKDKFDLDSGDDDDITISFEVDADKLTGGNSDYTFYINAVGEIDDKDSEYYKDSTGDWDSKEIEIVTDDSFVIVNNIQINPSSVSCGEILDISADVWNIDDYDLDDDEVYVLVYNKELGINKLIEFDSGIDSMESEQLNFQIQLPEDVDEKDYAIKFVVYDNDDLDDDDIFETGKGDDKDASYQEILTVEGSCSTIPSVDVIPTLESEAKAGQELIIKALIINTGSKKGTFAVSLTDYDSWATLSDIDKTSLDLESEESAEIIIKLKPNEESSGENKFNVLVTEGNKIFSKPVTVTVEKSLLSGFSAITGLVSGLTGNSWYLWAIGGLNVLLVLIIIVVAVKISKKKD